MDDLFFMKEAINLAKQGEGKVNPNPLVGAIVVKNNKIIGRGYHKKFGDSHAEVFALNEAGENSKDATLYVTLEPCSHYGKTPPCAKKIIESGIKKCVIAMEDPNPLVSGNGINILKEAGIEVLVGILENEAKDLNRIFIKYIKNKIPFLFLKCAITLDGKIATRTYQSKWITNNVSRTKVQKLRNKFMSIMVGINTIIQDNPSLDARVENARNPYRIVIDPYCKLPLDAKILKFNDDKNVLITSIEEKNNINIEKFKKLGVNIIFLDGREFLFKDILKKIGNLGIDSILLEGGGTLISNAFKEKVIDGGEIFIAPKILGDKKAIPFINGFNIENMDDSLQLKNIKINQYGSDCSFEFYF